MDAKSTETLELGKVLERVAALASFSASKALALKCQPTAVLEEARRRQRETSEARHLLSLGVDLSSAGARDVRPQVGSAARGRVLDPEELLKVGATLARGRAIRRRLLDHAQEAPWLAQAVEGMETLKELEEAIAQVLDDQGQVLDSASKKLASLRREAAQTKERLGSKLERLIHNPKIAPMLQEPIITQREGRYVVPLRAEFKGQLPAVVHDQSSSGATLFVEPLAVVDLNNRLRELELAERDEVRRILGELSRRVGEKEAAIGRMVEALALVDFAAARARYALRTDSVEPVLHRFEERDGPHPGSVLRLIAARHPLLDPEQVVPLDLALDDETYALVITGPNTGGKTVTLKTAGLLALMAQCGLHIPAASGSELSVFDAIFADIGDEQSIEQSLSTFSAHIANIIRILERAGRRSLVLLDELGAGTDPQEGSALARALLSAFLERRCTTLVATHYPELKAFAHITPGVRNASVEFDPQTLQPTYRLVMGLPGRSNALAIARRLGLDEQIVERARAWLAPQDLQADRLLDEIQRQREAAEQARLAAQEARRQAEALRAELEARLGDIGEERRRILEAARQEAQERIEALEEELATLRRALKRAGQPLEALRPVEEGVKALAREAARPSQPRQPEASPARPLRAGDRVWLERIAAGGVISALEGQEAEVQVGRLRMRVRLEELRPLEKGEEGPQAPRPRAAGPPAGVAAAPPLQLDLRGMRVDEALDALERRLDAAYLAGMPILRVVHGKGTGRLREAIRDFLRRSPYVESFETGHPAEGGTGVTVVHLST
jgi:DNA mismatch repair protein MutS2